MYRLYTITNNLTKKIYIGVSKNPYKRFINHKSSARKNHNHELYKDMRMLGFNNFLLCVLPNNIYTKKDALIKEALLINSCKNVYNIEKVNMRTYKKPSVSNHMIGNQRSAVTCVITFPDGKEEIVSNVIKFCQNNNLDSSSIIKVAKGKRKHHKHFKARYSK